MVREMGLCLRRVMRVPFAAFLAAVFVLLFLLVPPSPPALAGTETMCAQPVNACGCTSCGCGKDYGRPACPEGQSLFDDYCLPDCPSGFIRYPGRPGLCMPPCHHGCPEGYDQVPLPQCPQGFVRDIDDPDRCLPDVGRQRNATICPEGLSYSSETGRCEVNCPSGMFRNEVGICESYYTRECPKDLVRDPETGRCLPPGTWPNGYYWVCLPHCPPGTERDIRHPTRCIPPPPDCPQGFDNLNGRCVPVCEQGLQRDAYGYCVPPPCEQGTYPNLRGQCVPAGCPEGSEQVRGQCMPVCEQGWLRDDNGRCVPPDDGCTQGEEMFNGQCVPVCKEGQERDKNGRCMPPDRSCPRGQEKFRGQCVPVCKVGLVRDQNGRCMPPVPVCPQGKRLNPKTKACERIPTGNPDCPKGMTYSTSAKKCVTRDVPESNCPDGMIKTRDGGCVPIRDDQPDCPRGYLPDGDGGCERVVPLVPQGCPDGRILDKRTGRCVPLRRVPEQVPDDGFDDNNPDEPPVIRRIKPNLKLDPQTLQELAPARRQKPSLNQDGGCPDGMFRDKNGRCVEG